MPTRLLGGSAMNRVRAAAIRPGSRRAPYRAGESILKRRIERHALSEYQFYQNLTNYIGIGIFFIVLLCEVVGERERAAS
jgi:hypothetical protein